MRLSYKFVPPMSSLPHQPFRSPNPTPPFNLNGGPWHGLHVLSSDVAVEVNLPPRAVFKRSYECVGMSVIFSRGTGGLSENEVEKIYHLSNGDSYSIPNGIMIGLRGG